MGLMHQEPTRPTCSERTLPTSLAGARFRFRMGTLRRPQQSESRLALPRSLPTDPILHALICYSLFLQFQSTVLYVVKLALLHTIMISLDNGLQLIHFYRKFMTLSFYRNLETKGACNDT